MSGVLIPAPGFQTEIVLIRHSSTPTPGSISNAGFLFPGSVASASFSTLYAIGNSNAPGYAPGRLIFSRWVIAWNPNTASGTSVRLVYADPPASNITAIATIGPSVSATPIVSQAIITTTMNAILAGTTNPFPATLKILAHQTLGDGGAGPLIYSSTIELVWAS